MEEEGSVQEHEMSLHPSSELCDNHEKLVKSASETSETANEILSIQSETEKG